MQKLRLKSFAKGWLPYCRSGKKPPDIPSSPQAVYGDAGWNGWPDWLGNGVRRGGWRPFDEARSFVRSLKLTSQSDWDAYCRSGKRPADIPNRPHATYADTGWSGYGDWLGTGRRTPGVGWRPFSEAQVFVQKLRLKSADDWRAYSQSGKKPDDIPAHPNRIYFDVGWSSWNDWLGNKYGRRRSGCRPFDEARSFVQRLQLKSYKDWKTYCRSGKMPADIPKFPDAVYADTGWSGYGDWLGNGVRRGG